MAKYRIAELTLRQGLVGIGPLPGRARAYAADLNEILRWGADLVFSMTTMAEMEKMGAGALGDDLAAANVGWVHLPIADFGVPPEATAALWPHASAKAHQVLTQGGKVFAHCYGGCGRSGMALLRLMVEAGEDPDLALKRLRMTRPCAVETDAQFEWAGQVA